MKLSRKIQDKVDLSIAELEELAQEASFEGDAEDYLHVARNLRRGEWKAAYRNCWGMDTAPRDRISDQTYHLISLLGE